ncbi:6-bladed beta-propeller [Solirubrobacter soli]|uniref:6-bladed beta-propeller n=1 Tax=Solirubrobacter soli TaxID=363832 RepID=UPI00041168EE|nr:6-bladed beta-propeller [Solirubrobacter soli]
MRFFVAALAAALILLAPGVATAACPGADPCPYSASSVTGQRSGGVLRFPQATALGPDGSIYVGDQLSHVIQVFGPDGAFQREIGAPGTGPGQLTAVGGVAVAADGTVYVVDGSDRVLRFAADGTFLSQFGSSGSGPGEFHFGAGGGNDAPAGGGIALGPDGTVYVADTRNDRIQRFAADGSSPVVIVPAGRVKRPQGLAVSKSRLIVADDLNHRLAIFDTGGRFIRTVGTGEGNQPDELQNPYDVAVDPSGRVYVADNSNHRIVRYGPAPAYTYRARWASFGPQPGHVQFPRGIAVDASGKSFIADPGGNRIDLFDVGGTSLGAFGIDGRASGQFIQPLGVGADASGIRAVADSINGRIVLLNPDGSVASMYGAPAPGPTLLPDPVGVAFDASGEIYVVDQERSRVLVFDRTGRIVRSIGSRGRNPGQLLAPSAVAVSPGGTVYVADEGNGRVVRFTTAGTHLGSFGSYRSLRGIAVSPDGSRVYTVDSARNKITVSTAAGGDVAEFGATGSKLGQLRSPSGIATDAAGNVWVADRGNDRVQEFTPDGTPVTAFGEWGTQPGQFIEPVGISVDCRGLVTVGDSDNNRVQTFQAATPGACATLPQIQSPPAPILYTQPGPVPPVIDVTATRTANILGIRQFPLRVNSDTPVKLAVTVTLKPRSGSKRSVKLTLSQPLAAGKTVTVRPRLSASGAATLRRALGKRRGLTADVRVTATPTDGPVAVFAKRLDITG